ncbi:MAG: hypothetical protein AAB772_02900 [Patescibacteria group bacterium]
MNFFIIYLAERALHRIFEFFRHWYVRGFLNFSYKAIEVLEGLDQTFALKITIRNFFSPLFGDYTILGRILGFIFRSGRMIIGLIVYSIVILFFIVAFSFWVFIPVYVVFRIFYF